MLNRMFFFFCILYPRKLSLSVPGTEYSQQHYGNQGKCKIDHLPFHLFGRYPLTIHWPDLNLLAAYGNQSISVGKISHDVHQQILIGKRVIGKGIEAKRLRLTGPCVDLIARNITVGDHYDACVLAELPYRIRGHAFGREPVAEKGGKPPLEQIPNGTP